MLGWDEVVELDRGGTLRFEPHTVTHPNLLLLDDAASRHEIAQSKLDLEAMLARPAESFCYPAGLFGERERRFVAESGFRAAVSCEPGVNLPGADPLTLRRRQIDPADRRLDFRAKVGGGHDTPLPLRGLYRRLRYGEGTPQRPPAAASPLMEFTPTLRPSPARAAGRLLGTAAALAAFAAALSLFLYRHPPSALIIVAFAVVILGALWLSIVAYDVALAVAVVLLAAVRFEPAPADVVFAVLIIVGAITSRFRLRRVIPGAVLLVGAYLALNLISAVGAADPQRAVSLPRDHLLRGVLRALARRLRHLVGDRTPDHPLLRRGRGRLRARLHARAAGAVSGPRRLHADRSGRGPVQGPERVRALPRPRSADRARGDPHASPAARPASDEGGAVLRALPRRALLVLPRGLAEPRRRAGRGARDRQLPARRRQERGPRARRRAGRARLGRGGRGVLGIVVVPRAAREGAPELRQRPVQGAIREHHVGAAEPVRDRPGAVRAAGPHRRAQPLCPLARRRRGARLASRSSR